MNNLYKLRNQIKHYEWGSANLIPRLLGVSGDGSPWAELWMGSHADSPSLVSLPSGDVSLGALIAGDPCRYLGEKTARRYGELPFLFKLLAIDKPLSIQAHPNAARAREGFERENRAQIAHNAPNRNYRDPGHKPEIFCALTPFTGMCGFRNPGEIARLLSVFPGPGTAGPASVLLRDIFTPLLRALEIPEPALALQSFFGTLFRLPPEARQALTDFILSSQEEGGDPGRIERDLVREFARQYPGDPAIIAPLYLNVFHLEPGEAIFINAGVLHAYIHGFGVELMANSDNVLRGGLTPKHVDIPELIKVLDFTPMQPQIIKPEFDSHWCFTYPVPCAEFSLTVMCGFTGGGFDGGSFAGGAQQTNLARSAPAIVIVPEGEVSIGGTLLKQGESAFIPARGNKDPLVLQGNYTLYAASVPS